MAEVRLTDVIDTTIYRNIESESAPELTAYFESGVVVGGEYFDNLCAADGRTAELVFWRDIDPGVEPNYSSDDPTSEATPNKIVQSKMIAKKAHLNNGWSSMDLARELQMGTDAMEEIRRRTDMYWMRRWQRRLISMTKGIKAANEANRFDSDAMVAGTAEDMIHDISVNTAAAVTDAARFSRSAFITAAFTMGDHVDDIAAIAVHSVIYERMLQNDDIDFIADSKGNMVIPLYLGKRVIVDDALPADVVADTIHYTSILFGQAAFGYGKSDPTTPVEVDRNPRQGDGGGQEELWERKSWLLHPLGWNNDYAVATGNSGNQTNANLEEATNWTRSVSRKNAPLAFLVTND